MTREEEIYEASKKFSEYEYNQINFENGFIDGANWADKNPVNVWHDINDEPKKYPILCEDKKNRVWIDHNLKDYIESWDMYVEFCEIIRWAYISDLLPKGGD